MSDLDFNIFSNFSSSFLYSSFFTYNGEDSILVTKQVHTCPLVTFVLLISFVVQLDSNETLTSSEFTESCILKFEFLLLKKHFLRTLLQFSNANFADFNSQTHNWKRKTRVKQFVLIQLKQTILHEVLLRDETFKNYLLKNPENK